MEAVTIRGKVPFDLIDILLLSERDVRKSVWRCSNVEAIGELADELHGISDDGLTIDGREMLRLASGVQQIIDGDFKAYRGEQENCWLCVRAVDSSLYVVITDDKRLLARIRDRFHDVQTSPDDAAFR